MNDEVILKNIFYRWKTEAIASGRNWISFNHKVSSGKRLGERTTIAQFYSHSQKIYKKGIENIIYSCLNCVLDPLKYNNTSLARIHLILTFWLILYNMLN